MRTWEEMMDDAARYTHVRKLIELKPGETRSRASEELPEGLRYETDEELRTRIEKDLELPRNLDV